MTLRYAHLAQGDLEKAMSVLSERAWFSGQNADEVGTNLAQDAKGKNRGIA